MLKKFSLSLAVLGMAVCPVLFPAQADSSNDVLNTRVANAGSGIPQLVAPPRTVKSVMVMADGHGRMVSTSSRTVQDVLKELKIVVGPNDLVSPSRNTVLTGNQLVTVTRLSITTKKKNTVVPFKKVVADSEMDCGDTGEDSRVTTTGVDGIMTEVWNVVTMEGSKPIVMKKSKSVTKKPVDEVTTKCVKYETVTTTVDVPVESSDSGSSTATRRTDQETGSSSQSSSSSSSSGSSSGSSSVRVTGTKADWMRAAGIPESDWKYVDYIVTKESGWNYKAVNPSSGATGLCQSLPASKMASAGGDYLTNPITQLKWCDGYAKQRYNGWEQSYYAWISKKWW